MQRDELSGIGKDPHQLFGLDLHTMLRLMTGPDVARLLERELLGARVLFRVDRLEQKADMIAEIELLQHRAREPAFTRIEYRHAMREVPGYSRELVHLIARLCAKELGDVLIFLFDDVYRERDRSECELKSVVFLRNACEKTGWMNAALSSEANEAARTLVLEGRSDDIERIVKRCDELLEP